MNGRFQVGKPGRLVAQLGDPQSLLILQLLLHLLQHFLDVFQHRSVFSLHAHFHLAPAILAATPCFLSPQGLWYDQPTSAALFGTGPAEPHAGSTGVAGQTARREAVGLLSGRHTSELEQYYASGKPDDESRGGGAGA